MLIKKIQPQTDLDLVTRFVENAGSSLQTFRYFDSRPISIISNHIVTLIVLDNQQPVGYGHLDPEHGIVWLGIAVAESHTGISLGKQLVAALIEQAKLNNVEEIRLSVDKVNLRAIKLYEKNGFILTSTKQDYFVYTLKIS